VDVFETIADPSRRQILSTLTGGPQTAGRLVAQLPELSQPAVSRHLKLLREAGLVEVSAVGQQRIYSLRIDGFSDLDSWLEQLRGYWSRHLRSLENHLAAVEAGKPSSPMPYPGAKATLKRSRRSKDN
jgi:DNA-binding transcriptional ArsR family regulator